AYAPVKRIDPETTSLDNIGVLVNEIEMRKIDSLSQDRTGLGNSGESLIVQTLENNKVKYLSTLRHSPDSAQVKGLREAGIVGDTKLNYAIEQAVTGERVVVEASDYRNENTLAVTRYIPSLDWGVVVKIDTSEIYAPMDGLLFRFLVAGGITILAAFIIGIIFSQFLTRPLGALKETVSALGRGELPPRLDQSSEDEIGQMTKQINDLVQNLYNTASFARRIGDKDFDAEFKPASEKDILGNALISMRNSILNSAQADDERNWIVTGVAEIGDILRSTNELAELGEQILAYVVKKVNAVQGAFYVVMGEDFRKMDELTIEMVASHAYNKKKYLEAKFKFAEGLVGQAAIERDTILRTEIPEDYMTITSGLLGENKPECILITPLVTNDTEVYGVIELAGFERFSAREVKFVEEISEIIARTIFNIRVTTRTRKLLTESEQLNQDLKEREVTLQQNAREMAMTQEQLEKSNKELEFQIQQVENEQRKTQILLENASEVITIYEEDGTIRYISPSVEKILGYEAEEMIGTDDIVHIEQGVEAYKKMFEDLRRYPDERITIQFSYRKKSGESIWLEATGTNLLADPVINGIVLNIRDITERRRAEKEERMRGQMQALSENSPDLITRMNKEGKVFYINPTIENYTGKNKDQFLQKSLSTDLLPEPVINSWLSTIQIVERRTSKHSYEMEFPSVIGERIMQVNGIPEFNEDGSMESVLIVAHDITERKLQEQQLQDTNKKITDSINYAKRIQEAIMPDTDILQRFFSDSFIMFKPKDVVSGDFPWLVEKNGNVYVACVDCTGHGVPGALMSLIGYFLLNNIIDTRKNPTAGEILDTLDEQVTRTLRQDTGDSATKDGMDISLCKVDLKAKQLEYAGAHRPLYYLHLDKAELEEVKGNKFPIGGAQYRNRTNFDNITIQYKEGDFALLFSDGLPDQFGGPDNRKFSPKRIREIMKSHLNATMSDLNRTFEDQLSDWTKGGEVKQIDDILAIGIKF
ncbi:MAG: PAS domain S-box protein, partial [Thermonemataceae bacterium]